MKRALFALVFALAACVERHALELPDARYGSMILALRTGDEITANAYAIDESFDAKLELDPAAMTIVDAFLYDRGLAELGLEAGPLVRAQAGEDSRGLPVPSAILESRAREGKLDAWMTIAVPERDPVMCGEPPLPVLDDFRIRATAAKRTCVVGKREILPTAFGVGGQNPPKLGFVVSTSEEELVVAILDTPAPRWLRVTPDGVSAPLMGPSEVALAQSRPVRTREGLIAAVTADGALYEVTVTADRVDFGAPLAAANAQTANVLDFDAAGTRATLEAVIITREGGVFFSEAGAPWQAWPTFTIRYRCPLVGINPVELMDCDGLGCRTPKVARIGPRRVAITACDARLRVYEAGVGPMLTSPGDEWDLTVVKSMPSSGFDSVVAATDRQGRVALFRFDNPGEWTCLPGAAVEIQTSLTRRAGTMSMVALEIPPDPPGIAFTGTFARLVHHWAPGAGICEIDGDFEPLLELRGEGARTAKFRQVDEVTNVREPQVHFLEP